MRNGKRVAVVVGASGVIGGHLVEHLRRTGEWEVIGLSRRGGQDEPDLRHIAVDLLDSEDARNQLGPLSATTHIFYAAYQDRPTWAGLVEPNVAMLANVIDVIESIAPNLEHISLMQGYKVYGAHLGPFKTPARENDPNHMPPEFNVDQQRLLEDRRRGKSWSWTAIRPSVVCGFGLGSPMNLATVIAIYASMSKELGVPLRFPGAPGAYTSLIEMTDADLLAEATIWAATTPECADEAFNINNGDLFRWENMWPKVAEFFDLPVAPPLRMSLTDTMADKEGLWKKMIESHDLLPTPYRDVSSWQFGDFVFGWDYDFFADGSKARRFGFSRHVETEKMFTDIFSDLRRRRIIPATTSQSREALR
ncbi:SDR family oxidoreductase [Rhodococcus sp. H29-C3]|uniref:SDR family oxidoreductase n=1 Tax=Rhodococcus sp. H29-C3 TaxID=3046307 RepID=UPI0024BBD468|nr:SDR family oxidoreductase [Rhodococcus sp. H29-C3]MDJ0359828.1 SDR family oxidoreductase [Rhodococcus sp. H29-C3]